MRHFILQLAILAGLVAGSAALTGAQAAGGPQFVDPYVFLDKLRAVINTRQNRIETASILNAMPLNKESYLVDGDLRTRCYFDFGDVDRFLNLAAKGLKGVVVDPVYMQETGHGDTRAIYQNVNTLTIAFTTYEEKYNGFIILPSYSPQPGNDADDTTQLHESIHALAFGTGRTDLDEDGPGKDAPEYISGAFFVEQHNLARQEHKALTETLAVLRSLETKLNSLGDNVPEAEVNAAVQAHIGQIYGIAKKYLDNIKRLHEVMLKNSDHSWENVRALMGLWGGKADWDGLIRDTEGNVAVLSQLVSDASQGNASPDFNSNFDFFFFKKRCIPE
jgi:hypothetical protein